MAIKLKRGQLLLYEATLISGRMSRAATRAGSDTQLLLYIASKIMTHVAQGDGLDTCTTSIFRLVTALPELRYSCNLLRS